MAELCAIFYARFHPERGPSVIAQVPEDGLVASRSSIANGGQSYKEKEMKEHSKATLNFSDISAYIIPPYDLCGKSLSIRVAGGHTLLGWPVSLESETYARNRFTFDVCFVLREGHGDAESGHDVVRADTRAWEQVVKKTAVFFQALEVDDGILSAEEERMESGGVGTVVNSLLQKVFDQLNAYSEACVRVDKVHTLNLRLSSAHSLELSSQQPIPKVNIWDVPLLIRALPSPEEWTYDLVLARINSHIDGVNHVGKIAALAEVDVKLVKRAVKGLVSLERVKILDLFHFQAVYALTNDLGWFVKDEEMREECRRYVTIPSTAGNGQDTTQGDAPLEDTLATSPLTPHLLTLYNALGTTPSVHDFVLAHQSQLRGIDIRRFVTFGVLKGFLRRKHKYVLAVTHSSTTPQAKGSGSSGGKFGSGSGGKRSGEDAAKDFDRAWRKAALSSGWATPPFQLGSSLGETGSRVSPEKAASSRGEGEGKGQDGELSPEDEMLKGFLDGTHCLDGICVAMRMGEQKVLEKLRSGRRVFGDVVVFCK